MTVKHNIVYDGSVPVSATVIHEGVPYVADKNHPNFASIIEALEQDRPAEEVVDQFDVMSSIARGFKTARDLVRGVLIGTYEALVEAGMSPEEARTALGMVATEVGAGVSAGEDTLVRPPRPASNVRPISQEVTPQLFDAEAELALEPLGEDEDEEPQHIQPEPVDDGLDTLKQRDLQKLYKAEVGGSTAGLNNEEMRLRIRAHREGWIRDDLTNLNQRELQKLYKKLGLGSTHRLTKDDLRNRIRAHRSMGTVVDEVTVKGGKLFYKGEEMHGALADAIIAFKRQGGSDFLPLVRFMAKLEANPLKHSRESLYPWLKHLSFWIADNGNLIAYKGVHKNGETYTSTTSGTASVNGVEFKNQQIPQKIGDTVTMPRDRVAHNPAAGCSTGLHVGTVGFARGFGKTLIEIEIDPQDVVSVPTESSWQKLRVCKYKVLREVTTEDVRELGKKADRVAVA